LTARPTSVDRAIADDLDGTGLGIDLDLADLRAWGSWRRGGSDRRSGERPRSSCGRSVRVIAAAATSNRSISRSCGDPETAFLERDIGFAGLEQKARDLAALGVIRRSPGR